MKTKQLVAINSAMVVGFVLWNVGCNARQPLIEDMTSTNASAAPDRTANAKTQMKAEHAVATLQAVGDSKVSGTVRLTSVEGGLAVEVTAYGLKPGSLHGFHIHEYGDCGGIEARNAGEHFNPGANPHGQFGNPNSHAGDLDNLQADKDGVAKRTFNVPGISVSGPDHVVLGRSVVIHAERDDFRSQPAGNSGVRVACGVIGVSK